MQVVYTDRFLDQAKELPKETQTKLARLLELLEVNPFNPLLHTKRLIGRLSHEYSFRITRDWRVIFIFLDADSIKLVRVRHRKDVYR